MKVKTRESAILKEVNKMGFASIEEYENACKRQYESMTMTKEEIRIKIIKEWEELYKEYPELIESAQLFNEGEHPEWYTKRMIKYLGEGKTPLRSYEKSRMIETAYDEEYRNSTEKE